MLSLKVSKAQKDAIRNKCIATSNKGLTSSNNVCYLEQ